MKSCVLIGIGMGNTASLSEEARLAMQHAPLVAGADRMMQAVAPFVQGKTLVTYESQKIAAAFAEYAGTDHVPCAVFSGDTGFYSGATTLRTLLETDGWQVTVVPGISTAQYLSAQIGKPWQDWHLVSAHGTDRNLGIGLSYSPKTFFLTGGAVTVRSIAQFLLDHEAEAVLTVGSHLGATEELIFSASPAEILSRTDYDESLSCALVERMLPDVPHGALSDAFFVRNVDSASVKIVPMTKQFVRAAILSLLAVRDGETVWDIGAGTGAVSVDIAHAAHCAVHAVEYKEEACNLIRQNCAKAGLLNLEVVCNRAPECLSDLPAPNAVFVGGSEGELRPILRAAKEKNPACRIVVSCLTMETLSEIQSASAALGCDYEAVQISVSQSKQAGAYHLMTAQNPVWLVKLQ